jgi:hypothetical protein
VTYETSDIDKFYENDGSVLDMYSENPAGVLIPTTTVLQLQTMRQLFK